MKNIHVIATEKSSRLCKETHTGLHLTESMISKVPAFINQHIYITNSEEIKEGDWFLNTLNGTIDKCEDIISQKNVNLSSWLKKIVLTTDQDLIKDGVQAVDDDFLEWFIKNPSCEEVEVILDEVSYVVQDNIYKIIIPSEEPKQVISVRLENSLKQFNLTLEEALNIEQSKLKQIGFGTRSIIELQNLKPNQETLVRDYSNRSCQTCNLFNSNNDGEGACELELENECASYSNDETLEDFWISCLDDESDSVLYKQETLEEVAFRLFPKFINGEYSKENEVKRGLFRLGAKWQQEQNKNKYSEEDLHDAFFSGCQSERQIKPRVKCWEEFIEKFKKK